VKQPTDITAQQYELKKSTVLPCLSTHRSIISSLVKILHIIADVLQFSKARVNDKQPMVNSATATPRGFWRHNNISGGTALVNAKQQDVLGQADKNTTTRGPNTRLEPAQIGPNPCTRHAQHTCDRNPVQLHVF